jgi:ribosomal protein L7/L12
VMGGVSMEDAAQITAKLEEHGGVVVVK